MLILDSKNRIVKRESPFKKSIRIQEEYARALRGVAREVGKLIRGYNPHNQLAVEKLKRALRAYSEILGPWATNLARRFIIAVDAQDKNAWNHHSKIMSKLLRKELLNAPLNDEFEKLMEEQVKLITSIPIEAGERVQKLVMENLYKGERAEIIAREILKTEDITKNRATTIARTEIARAASVLTQTRAINVGSDSYIWKTSKDIRVRESHKKMDGKIVRWDTPPTLSDGTTTHAGQIYNCRCWCFPILPEGDYDDK